MVATFNVYGTVVSDRNKHALMSFYRKPNSVAMAKVATVLSQKLRYPMDKSY